MHEAPGQDGGSSAKFDAADLAVAALSSLVAGPICDASWHAIVVEHDALIRGLVGLAVGFPIGVAGLSFHWWKDKTPEFRDWSYRKARRWWFVPAIAAFAYVTGPEMYRRTVRPVATTRVIGEMPIGTAPVVKDVKQTPQPQMPAARSKQTLDELRAESGALLKIVEEQVFPTEHDWRVQLASRNPERMCVDLDGKELRAQISSLTNRVQNAMNGISVALKESGIDQDEMRSLMGYPPVATAAAVGDEATLQGAVSTLRDYLVAINGLGDKPTCQDVVMQNISGKFFYMTARLNALNEWMNGARQRLQKYREDLQKEARGAP